MMYGNIGSPERLDFTVIGAAVNRAARIESLCRQLDRNILVSDRCTSCEPRRRCLWRIQIEGHRGAGGCICAHWLTAEKH